MKKPGSGVLAFAALAAAMSAGATQIAEAGFTAPINARIYSITPQCRDFPNAPVIGRVAGYYSGSRNSRLSWVGCFQSFAECEQWRRVARGEINPPIQQNQCEERF